MVNKKLYKPIEITIATFESDESWTVGTANATQFKTGAQSLKVTSTNGALNTSALVFSGTNDYSAGAYFEIDVYIHDIVKTAGVSFALVKDAGATNYSTKSFTTLVQGWNRLRVNKEDMTFNGTFVAADYAGVKQARVGVQAMAGNDCDASFDNLRNVQRKAQFFLEFDDGLITVFSDALPIIESYGFKIGYLLITNKVGAADPNYESWANVLTMQSRGHVIGFHAHAAEDYSDNTYAQIVADMQLGQAKLRAEGINEPYHYAASQGKVNGSVALIQPLMFTSGRRHTHPSTFGYHDIPSDPWAQWGQVFANTTILGTAQGWIDDAITQQRGCALVGHHMDENNVDGNGVSDAFLDGVCSYLQSKQTAGLCEVVTREAMIAAFDARGS